MKPGEHAGALIAVSVIAIVFGTIGVSLRIYTRSYVLKQIWLDDYLAVVSYVSSAHSAFLNVITWY